MLFTHIPGSHDASEADPLVDAESYWGKKMENREIGGKGKDKK